MVCFVWRIDDGFQQTLLVGRRELIRPRRTWRVRVKGTEKVRLCETRFGMKRERSPVLKKQLSSTKRLGLETRLEQLEEGEINAPFLLVTAKFNLRETRFDMKRGRSRSCVGNEFEFYESLRVINKFETIIRSLN